MSEDTALIIQFILGGLAGIGAVISGLVYVKTKGDHGGFIFVVLAITAWSIGSSIWDVTTGVLE